MSKSREFRLKIQQKDHHEYRHRKSEEEKIVNETDFKDQVRGYRRGNDDQEPGPSIHKE